MGKYRPFVTQQVYEGAHMGEGKTGPSKLGIRRIGIWMRESVVVQEIQHQAVIV
jgi:hypothetical protein